MTLPIGTEPLTLADGTKINPLTGGILPPVEDALVEVPNNEQMQREIVTARKRINDLPLVPDKMNVVSIILTYTLYGVSDTDIATILHLPIDNIKKIKLSSAYEDIAQAIISNIVESDMSDVRTLFVEQSRNAASQVFRLMDSEVETTRLAASKDVLDRAGQRPVDVIEHRHKVEGGLTIEYIDKEQSEDIPIIDITPEGEF